MAQNPIDQHTVPKVYLKRFLPEGQNKLFALNVKPFEWKHKIKRYTPSQICYEPDFYTINTDDFLERLDTKDKYFIEKESFEYENNFLKEIFNQITNPQKLTLSYPKARKLLKMLLNIKRRNQAFRNVYLNKDVINRVVENQISGLRQNENLIKEGLKKTGILLDVNEVENLFRAKLKNKQYVFDMYREGFVNFWDDEKDSYNSRLVEALVKLKFFVVKTTPQNPFITNDNPGVTMMNNETIKNLGFNKNFFAFFFPIDPLHTLMFNRTAIDDAITFKKIVYRPAEQFIVDFVNHSAIDNCNKYAFSNCQDTLDNLKKHKLEN